MDFSALLIGFVCGFVAGTFHRLRILPLQPKTLDQAKVYLKKAKLYAENNGMEYFTVYPRSETSESYKQEIDAHMSHKEAARLVRAINKAAVRSGLDL